MSRAKEKTQSKRAWVLMIMMGDAYIPGALMTIWSLRNVKTKYPIVCMVTDDVSENATNALMEAGCNTIKKIEYITHNYKALKSEKQKQMYGAWMHNGFTAWRCLGLTDWDKIIYIHSDLLFVKNVDELFDMDAPAGCFSSPYAQPYDFAINPYWDYYRKNVDKTAKTLPHGAKLPPEIVLSSLELPTFTVMGAMIVLEPSTTAMEKMMKVIKQNEIYGEKFDIRLSAVDEMSIAETMALLGKTWTHIDQKYQAMLRKEKWSPESEALCYHYLGTKPWDLGKDEWDDTKKWWEVADKLIAEKKELSGWFGIGTDTVPATRLDIEYAQWRLTRDLQNLLSSHVKNVRAKYECDNILERWLLSMSNDKSAKYPNWDVNKTCVYKITDPSAWYNVLMAKELKAKEIARSDSDATNIVSKIRNIVASRMDKKPLAMNQAATCGEFLDYGSRFRTPATPRSKLLLQVASCEDVVIAAIRYATIISGGQHWGLTQSHADDLYTTFGVRNEGFASPFNSRFAGKKGGKFCSLFPDTDKPFGSLGDFTKVNMLEHAGGWLINPPFIENMLHMAAKKVIKNLEEAKTDFQVFFLMPRWKDTGAYELLTGSKYKRIEHDLLKNEFEFELPNSKRIVSTVPCLYFFLSSKPVTPSFIKGVHLLFQALNVKKE